MVLRILIFKFSEKRREDPVSEFYLMYMTFRKWLQLYGNSLRVILVKKNAGSIPIVGTDVIR